METQFFKAEIKRHPERVLLVPHFGGSIKTLIRHRQLFLELGYDCTAMTLSHQNHKMVFQNFFRFGLTKKFGLFELWKEEILKVAETFEEPLILMSLSSPSASVALALSEGLDERCRAWICDGGPFLKVQHCFRMYFQYQARVKSPLALSILSQISKWTMAGFSSTETDLKTRALGFRRDLPILSFRANEDKLVPEPAISKFLDASKLPQLEVCKLSPSDHLLGLRDHSEAYQNRIQDFLNSHAI